jgi:hypothetical protein
LRVASCGGRWQKTPIVGRKEGKREQKDIPIYKQTPDILNPEPIDLLNPSKFNGQRHCTTAAQKYVAPLAILFLKSIT